MTVPGNPFWGPNMTAVLDRARDFVPEWESLTPARFQTEMDQALGVQTDPTTDPEDVAAVWLDAMEQRGIR